MNKFREKHKPLTDGRPPMTNRQFNKLIAIFLFSGSAAIVTAAILVLGRAL